MALATLQQTIDTLIYIAIMRHRFHKFFRCMHISIFTEVKVVWIVDSGPFGCIQWILSTTAEYLSFLESAEFSSLIS